MLATQTTPFAPKASATAFPTPSLFPSPSAAAEASPTVGTTPATATATPQAAASATPNGTPCPVYYAQPGASQPLPDPASLTWQNQSEQAGGLNTRWRELSGFVSPVMSASAAPGGRWWAAQVLEQQTPGESVPTAALYVIDGASKGHWLVSKDGYANEPVYAWTSDSRLVWTSQGGLFIAKADGSGLTDLKAPEQVFSIWVGSGSQALANGLSGLWWIDLNSGKWQPVPQGVTGRLSSVGRWGYRLINPSRRWCRAAQPGAQHG